MIGFFGKMALFGDTALGTVRIRGRGRRMRDGVCDRLRADSAFRRSGGVRPGHGMRIRRFYLSGIALNGVRFATLPNAPLRPWVASSVSVGQRSVCFHSRIFCFRLQRRVPKKFILRYSLKRNSIQLEVFRHDVKGKDDVSLYGTHRAINAAAEFLGLP